MDKIVTQDPTQPGVFKVNGPALAAGNKIALSSLDIGGGSNGDVLTLVGGIWAPAAPGASSDTASNLGAGAQAFKSKVGADFQFRSIIGTAPIVATQNANDITLSLSGGGAFTSAFTSANQTITAAGALTVAHGLAGSPTLIQPRLKNTSGELGYSLGDEVIISPDAQDTANYGLSIVPDATNLNIRFGTAGVFILNHKTTGVPTAIDPTKWVLILRAWL